MRSPDSYELYLVQEYMDPWTSEWRQTPPQKMVTFSNRQQAVDMARRLGAGETPYGKDCLVQRRSYEVQVPVYSDGVLYHRVIAKYPAYEE